MIEERGAMRQEPARRMKARTYRSILGLWEDQAGKLGICSPPRWEDRSVCLVNILKEQNFRVSGKVLASSL